MFAGESDGITITKNVESPVYEVEFINERADESVISGAGAEHQITRPKPPKTLTNKSARSTTDTDDFPPQSRSPILCLSA
eukprot:scaffold1976_cov139-Skeletonema_dohrnii-CCMP3373.AAC.1